MTPARLVWLGLSVAAAVWLAVRGVPFWLNVGVLSCAVVPVLAGMFLRGAASQGNAAAVESVLWVAMATLGVASTGGAQSPLLVLFGVGLAIAVAADQHRLILETAVFSIAGYVVALVADGLGAWLGLGLQLAIASAYGAAGVAMIAVLGALAVQRHLQGAQADLAAAGGVRPAPDKGVAAVDDARLRQLETRLRESQDAVAAAEQALDSRTKFFAQTSHELRTPLNAIIGFADMMRSSVFGPLPEKYQEYAELIREGGRNLALVVDDVLDLSKIEAGRYEIAPEVLSLDDIAADVVRFLSDMAERRKVSLEMEPGDDVEAFADARATRQIALNLISNALKFTPEGGAVKVSAVETDGGAVLAVSDNGSGISAEELATLSEAFRQGAAGKGQKGTGLGLSVVRAFIELHGGSLEFESVEGGGTTVAVYFPQGKSES